MKKTRITLEDAVKLLCNHANIITQAEDVPLLNAPGRILAQDNLLKIRKRGILATTEECLLSAMALNLKRMVKPSFLQC